MSNTTKDQVMQSWSKSAYDEGQLKLVWVK